MRRSRLAPVILALAGPLARHWPPGSLRITLPNKPDSVKFLAMGDNGTGETGAVRSRHRRWWKRASSSRSTSRSCSATTCTAASGRRTSSHKFERPYKPLLDAGVKFYAALGNHDEQNNRFYKPWNMNGERYYTYTKKNVRFFVLDSDYIDPKQLDWLTQRAEGRRTTTGRLPTFTTRSTHRRDVTVRRPTSGSSSSRCSSSTASTSCSPDTTMSTSGSSRRRGSTTSSPGSAGQLRRGDLQRSALTDVGYDRTRRSCSSRSTRTRCRCRRFRDSGGRWIRRRWRGRSARPRDHGRRSRTLSGAADRERRPARPRNRSVESPT